MTGPWWDSAPGECGWCQKPMLLEDGHRVAKRGLGQWINLLVCEECVPLARREDWMA